MKTTLLILVIAGLVFFLSCNKDSDAIEMKQVTSGSEVDTIIFAIDTLQYSFGSFGAKDELLVIKHPSHAKLFELADPQAAIKVLHYAPQDEYLGIDSVIVLTKRISEETEPVIKIDSTLLIIRTIKNITHKKLIGKWILTLMCGGVTGGCDSIDPVNATQLEFGFNMDFTESYKGSISKKLNYYLVDSIGRHFIFVNDVSYEGKKFKRKFEYYNNDHLAELNGDMYYIYFHLEE